jgi:hypothetical protein
MKKLTLAFTLVAGTMLLTPASPADDSDSRVARVSYVGGSASYQRGDVDGWNALRVNTPLVTGDSFFAADGGRAEVDLGRGIVVRVDGGTQVDLVNNTRDIAQLGLTNGFVDVRASSIPRGFTLEIDTPSGAVTILEPGRYQVGVADQGATYSVVRGGMSLALDGQQLDVRQGESLELSGGDSPTYGYGTLPPPTPFQEWAGSRDSRFEHSDSARYVNHDVVGYEDLDGHGTWAESREYGRVWMPSGMAAGWAPYQAGRWIWQDPYGWTWVSDEPWGWAPYHYGRWIQTNNAWGWVPPPPQGYRGPAVVMNIQPVYAPALVGFIGGSNWGLSLSIGGPAIGWVPLAPAERYYYPWQQAPRVTNNYTNITINNAVTVVNYNTFATQPVRPIRVEAAQIERAPVIGLAPVGVVPRRESLVVSSGGSPGPSAVPRGRPERPVVARLVPPPRPEPFAQKVVQIEKTGRPVANPVVMQGMVGKPFVPGVPAPTGVRAFSGSAPESRKDLKARPGAEARPAKKIERDITPLPPASAPVAAPAVAPSAVTPPAVAPPARPAPTPGHATQPVQPDPRATARPGLPNEAARSYASPQPVPLPAVPPTPRPVQPDPRPQGAPPTQPRAVPDHTNPNGNAKPSAAPRPVPTPPEPRSTPAVTPPPATQSVVPPPAKPEQRYPPAQGHPNPPPKATPSPDHPAATPKPTAPPQAQAETKPPPAHPAPPQEDQGKKKKTKGNHPPEPSPSPSPPSAS